LKVVFARNRETGVFSLVGNSNEARVTSNCRKFGGAMSEDNMNHCSVYVNLLLIYVNGRKKYVNGRGKYVFPSLIYVFLRGKYINGREKYIFSRKKQGRFAASWIGT